MFYSGIGHKTYDRNCYQFFFLWKETKKKHPNFIALNVLANDAENAKESNSLKNKTKRKKNKTDEKKEIKSRYQLQKQSWLPLHDRSQVQFKLKSCMKVHAHAVTHRSFSTRDFSNEYILYVQYHTHTHTSFILQCNRAQRKIHATQNLARNENRLNKEKWWNMKEKWHKKDKTTVDSCQMK